MRLGSILSTRPRRLSYIVLLAAASALIPWTTQWVQSVLTVVIISVLAKTALEGLTNSIQTKRLMETQWERQKSIAESNRSLHVSIGRQIADSESTRAALKAGQESLRGDLKTGQESLRADLKSASLRLTSLVEESSRLSDEAKAARAREDDLLQRLDAVSSRIDRTETMLTQLASARGGRQQKLVPDRQLDGPPESQLAAPISQLRSDFGY